LLDPAPNRDEVTLRAIVNAPAVKGTVVVLGPSDAFVTMLVAKPEVTAVYYVPGRRVTPNRSRKLRLIEFCNPLQAQRRDFGLDCADFLFCDLFRDPFERNRAAVIKSRFREFIPRAGAYRWQEIDVMSEWCGEGYDFENPTGAVFPLYAVKTGIMISPATAEYAAHCRDVTKLAMQRLI